MRKFLTGGRRSETFSYMAWLLATRRIEWGFVWGVWLVLSLMHFGAAVQLNTGMPRNDDWALVRSYLAWSQGRAAELFTPFNIHFVPGFKGLLFSIWCIGGVSLTYIGIVGALLLALGTAVGMTLVLSKLPRDRDVYLHATIPLLLMGVAPMDVVTWATGLGLVVFSVGSFLVLCLIASQTAEPSRIAWSSVWLLLCILCVMGTLGIIFAVPVVLMLGVWLGVNWRTPIHRQTFIVVAVAAAIFIFPYILVASWIVLGEVQARSIGDRSYVGFSMRSIFVAIEFLASPFGDLAKRLWPVSGLAIVAFFFATLLLWLRLRNRLGSMRWLVMGAGALGFFMIATSVGIGRWWQGGFGRSYILYIVPVYFIAYFLWCWAGALGRIVRVAMFATFCGVSLWIQGEGIQKLREYRESETHFLQEIARGVPSIGLAANNGLGAGETELESLRASGIAPFSRIKPAPIMEAKVISSQQMRWHDAHVESQGRVQTRGKNSFLEISLPNSDHIFAVRLEYSHQSTRKFLTMRLMGLRVGSESIYGRLLNAEVTRSFWREVHRKRAVQVFWLDSPVESLALFPDTVPCQFEIHKVEVLTKPSDIAVRGTSNMTAAR